MSAIEQKFAKLGRRNLLARRDRAHRGTRHPGTARRSSWTSSIRAWCTQGRSTRICARRQLSLSAIAAALGAAPPVRACAAGTGRGHRHAGHRVQSRSHRQHPPQLFTESRAARQGCRAHRADDCAVPEDTYKDGLRIHCQRIVARPCKSLKTKESSFGGESGIRTPAPPVDSVTCRVHNAGDAVDASDAVAPCPRIARTDEVRWRRRDRGRETLAAIGDLDGVSGGSKRSVGPRVGHCRRSTTRTAA